VQLGSVISRNQKTSIANDDVIFRPLGRPLGGQLVSSFRYFSIVISYIYIPGCIVVFTTVLWLATVK